MNDVVNLSEASRRTGIHRATLRRAIARGALQLYRCEADTRAKLVRLADVEALKMPVPQLSGRLAM